MTLDALLRCVEECLDCAVICTACPDGLDVLDGPVCHPTVRSGRADQHPADFRLVSAVIEFCAEACRVCAEQCEQHAARDELCLSCTEACRRCRTACERLAAMIGAAMPLSR